MEPLSTSSAHLFHAQSMPSFVFSVRLSDDVMDSFRLIAEFVGRVNRVSRDRECVLSRSQIRRVGDRAVAEIYEAKRADDSDRDAWLESARVTVEGAVDSLFRRQFRAESSREIFVLQTVAVVLRGLADCGAEHQKWDGWIATLRDCSDIRVVAEILSEIFDAVPDIGDRYYARVDIIRDMQVTPDLRQDQRRPGAASTAFG
jgi:hypothetical protein